MLNDTVVLRGRYRTSADTLVLEADLSEHRVIATVREDHDVDQVVEWARLSRHTSLVLQSVQVIGVEPLEGMGLLTPLPQGAAALVALLRDLAVEEGVGRCEVERRVPLASLSLPAPRLRHPSEHVPQAALVRSSVVRPPELPASLGDDALRACTAAGSTRTRAAVRELLACRAEWPELHHSGALMRAWDAIVSDESLGDDRFALTEELYAHARLSSARGGAGTGRSE